MDLLDDIHTLDLEYRGLYHRFERRYGENVQGFFDTVNASILRLYDILDATAAGTSIERRSSLKDESYALITSSLCVLSNLESVLDN